MSVVDEVSTTESTEGSSDRGDNPEPPIPTSIVIAMGLIVAAAIGWGILVTI